ncbi:PadR family transcriptional regulator [Devosia sp. XJ19-1]|uniref:PadR family transcriptional regulator n=1 Tax=Devosia ureilytica TaxID=2952754 RepID=A0A9Q4FSA3_9HYPH|nr:PadR family transcriptional regulator [Devosia ureilytica]MCP8882987.1 PadR family transcriptional regulator [Devosia ureilytica]MCP8886645.1 PadR family transcriptional regulator [Devosia ureilytica]
MSYWKNGEPDWRQFERMARRGWGRMARMADEELGGVGGSFRVGRMLASGDLRLVALYFIEQQPRHGYDLIKAVEERSNGVYSPSPGIVYPALTYLEEAGYVTSASEGNKKLYTITDEGRAHLNDNREAVASTLDFLGRTGEQMSRFREFVKADWPFGGEARPEDGNVPPRWAERGAPGGDQDRPMHDATPELEASRKALKDAIKKVRRGSEDQQHRAAAILQQAAKALNELGDDEVDI